MLDKLFNPQSVAVVGATPKEGKVGHIVLKNIISKFLGKVYAVNPSYTEILGVKCYPSVLDIPYEVDLIVIVVPARAVLDVLEQCGKKGVRNAVVITAGFKEIGREGAILEAKLTEICRKYGINLVGPNCLGIINTHAQLNATFSKTSPPKGNIAFLSQSGAFILAVIDWAISSNFGFSKIVSLGNKAVLDECDFMEYLASDDETDVIMLYLEGVRDGRRFIEVARKVSKKKPVVVMKSGRTEAGARAASSHTGTLAGSFAAFKAAFQQCGVVQADTIEELFDFSLILSNIRNIEKGIAIVTNSGGPGVMAADAVETFGLELARFERETIEKLKDVLPPEASIYNPVDVIGDADADRFGIAARIISEDRNVGAIIAILTPTARIDFDKAADYIAGISKPVVTCFMGGESILPAIEKLKEHRIMNFFDPVRAVKALSAVSTYSKARDRAYQEPVRFEVNKEVVRDIINEIRKRRAKIVGVEGLKVLEAYGIKVAPYGLARTADEAVEIADRIGYPVAMKIVSPDIIHKSDVGCVKLNVGKEDVKRTFFEIVTRAESYMSNARIDGVLVQKMIKGGKEVIVGMKRDPHFGPLLMFGMGGIYVEVFKDVSFRIAPVSRGDALEMIKSVKAYKILRGVRGEKMSDIESIVDVLLRISQLSLDFPDILEMDVNPIMVFEKGCCAIDFRMVVDTSKEV